MKKSVNINEPKNWSAIINDSQLSNAELSRRLNDYGYQMSVSGVQALRNGETNQPRHDTGEAILAICRAAKRQTQKHPSMSRSR